MEDFIEQPGLLATDEPLQFMGWETEDDSHLTTLSHFSLPYCEGDTPLFI